MQPNEESTHSSVLSTITSMMKGRSFHAMLMISPPTDHFPRTVTINIQTFDNQNNLPQYNKLTITKDSEDKPFDTYETALRYADEMSQLIISAADERNTSATTKIVSSETGALARFQILSSTKSARHSDNDK